MIPLPLTPLKEDLERFEAAIVKPGRRAPSMRIWYDDAMGVLAILRALEVGLIEWSPGEPLCEREIAPTNQNPTGSPGPGRGEPAGRGPGRCAARPSRHAAQPQARAHARAPAGALPALACVWPAQLTAGAPGCALRARLRAFAWAQTRARSAPGRSAHSAFTAFHALRPLTSHGRFAPFT